MPQGWILRDVTSVAGRPKELGLNERPGPVKAWLRMHIPPIQMRSPAWVLSIEMWILDTSSRGLSPMSSLSNPKDIRITRLSFVVVVVSALLQPRTTG